MIAMHDVSQQTIVGTSISDAVVEQMKADLVPSLAAPGRAGRWWIASLLLVILASVAAYIWQLVNGLAVTGMGEYVTWGVYMTNFVFFIGVSHAGTLISAILRVTNAEWRRSITRMAEAITVFALLVGAPMVIIDMGRPDRVLNVLIHGRLSSPILWDVCAIATYIVGSVLYLYVAMIPDLALLVKRRTSDGKPSLRQSLYRTLSLGYRGTPEQRRLLDKALGTMAIIIIPVAVSVHSVVSWIFSMTLRPGWHSTIFGPYFVIGAIFSGTAAIITAMAVFRKVFRLEAYLTFCQFKNLARLLLALNLLYVYFTLSEYLTGWFGSEASDTRLLDILMGQGLYGALFWCVVVFALFIPAVLLGLPNHGSIRRIVVAAVLINIGMWIKRYLIIVPTLLVPYIPAESAGVHPSYTPTWVEWTVSAGGLAFFLLMFTLFAKVFPILSIWETAEGVEELGARHVGVEITPPIVSRPALGAVAVLFAVVLLPSASLAQAAGSTPPVSTDLPRKAAVVLRSDTEEGKKVLIATVTSDGRPVERARVAIRVKRLFGWLVLGQEETLDDGTAAVPFPADLPGGMEGQIQVNAEVMAPTELAGTKVEARFDGAARMTPQADPFPRALWSPRAPLPLVFFIFTILAAVWLTYGRVVWQLFSIRKS